MTCICLIVGTYQLTLSLIGMRSKLLHLIADEPVACLNGGMTCVCPPEWTGDMCRDGMEIRMPAIVRRKSVCTN